MSIAVRILLALVAGAVAAVIVKSVPDINRYRKMREM
jgi:hypothetical protein